MAFDHILKRDFQSGHPTAGISAEWLNEVANIFNDIEGIGCTISKTVGQRGMGWKIIVGDGSGSADISGPYHFKCELVSTSQFKVYGGSWWRHDGDEVGTAVPLTTDVGTSADTSDAKTITVSGSNVTKYAYLVMDDSKDPANLSVGFDTLANIDADNVPKTRLTLAAVVLDGSGNIESIEQYWRGGDFSDAWITPDDKSIEFTNAGATFEDLQIFGWSAAIVASLDASSKFPFKDNATGTVKYTNQDGLGAWLAEWIDDNGGITWNSLDDTTGNPSTIGDDYMPITDGGSMVLKDLTATGIGPFWVKGLTYADCYGSSIGKDASTMVIDLTYQQLMNGAGTSVMQWSGTEVVQYTGDFYWVNAGTGLPYGEIYGYDTNATQTISGTGIANKVQIDAFDTNGVSNLMTPDHTNDHITVTLGGTYKISVAVTLESAAGSTFKAGCAVYKNNGATLLSNLHFHRQLAGGGGDTGSASMTGLVSLTANDTIEVWIWNETNTADIIVDDITLDIVMVGG